MKNLPGVLSRGAIVMVLLVPIVRADPPKIDVPATPTEEPAPAQETAPAREPISTVVSDAKDKDWKEYDNRIVRIHARVNAAWTVMELKETRESGSVGFTLSRIPLVTFSVNREPMEGPFEAWVSSDSLSSLYPSGYRTSRTVFAGRQAVLIKGIAKDGRLEESYFSSAGPFLNQVIFAAPPEAWKDAQEKFTALQRSFRWLK